jgi:hypothetical protein
VGEERKNMSKNRILAAIVAAIAAATAPPWTATSDCRFELEDAPTTAGKATVAKLAAQQIVVHYWPPAGQSQFSAERGDSKATRESERGCGGRG